jgi:hypothetical protein
MRRILCYAGIHRWRTQRNPEGEAYTECSACGKYTVTLERGNKTRAPGI